MTNETLVERIRSGIFETDNMQLLYENNLPLIRKIIGRMPDMSLWRIYYRKAILDYGRR